MFTIYTTEQFDRWFTKLKDPIIKRRIQARIDRLEDGHFGDSKFIEENLFECRFFFGPDYRVYGYKQEQFIIILLTGGDKSSQQNDIKKALKLIEELKKDTDHD